MRLASVNDESVNAHQDLAFFNAIKENIPRNLYIVTREIQEQVAQRLFFPGIIERTLQRMLDPEAFKEVISLEEYFSRRII